MAPSIAASSSPGAAPIAMTMETRIEALSPSCLPGANAQANDFIGRKAMCACCPYRWCPTSDKDFSLFYQKNPGNYETSAVAVSHSPSSSSQDGSKPSEKVVGYLQMSLYGQPRDSVSEMLYTLRPGEAYIEQLSVAAEMRGHGIGTRMLEWSEEKARSKGATVLSLGVVAGNPAERLYQRFGFEVVEDHSDLCSSLFYCFFLGCPHGECGGKTMEKRLTKSSVNDHHHQQNVTRLDVNIELGWNEDEDDFEE